MLNLTMVILAVWLEVETADFSPTLKDYRLKSEALVYTIFHMAKKYNYYIEIYLI